MDTAKTFNRGFGICLWALLAATAGATPGEAQTSVCGTNQQFGGNSAFGPETNTFTTGAGTSPCPNTGNPVIAAQLGVPWVTTRVDDRFMVGIAFGPGQNDQVMRLYGTAITTNTVQEFTFDVDASAWSNTSNINLPFYSERAIELAAGRNDDVLRLYVGEFNQSGTGREYTWNGSSWDGVSMGNGGTQLLNLVIGPARNDGILRAYFSTGSSPPFYIHHEFSFSESGWTHSSTPLPPGYLVGAFGIGFGDGRNDGTLRLYEGVTGTGVFGLYELTWNGEDWDLASVAPVSSQVMGGAVGDGQNDGVNRVYVVARDFGVLEYTFADNLWSLSNSIPVGREIFDVAIGPGRNDGVNRLYILQENPGVVFEGTFADGSWSLATLGTPGGLLFHLRLGVARDDLLNRVYAAGQNGLFEFEAPGAGSTMR